MSDVMSVVLPVVLTAVLPIITVFIVQVLAALFRKIGIETSGVELEVLRGIVADAVAAAEQKGKVSKLTNAEKYKYALELATKVALLRGAPPSTVGMVGQMIEAVIGGFTMQERLAPKPVEAPKPLEGGSALPKLLGAVVLAVMVLMPMGCVNQAIAGSAKALAKDLDTLRRATVANPTYLDVKDPAYNPKAPEQVAKLWDAVQGHVADIAKAAGGDE